MKFDLTQGAKGEWFPFFGSEITPGGETNYLDPEPGAGRVCLRIADADTLTQIHAQTRKRKSEFVLNPQTRKMERVNYFDQSADQEEKEREMIWDHAIVDWENILDANGAPIPCTLENKLKLLSIPVFARFIGRCLQLLGEQNAEKQADAEKN